MNHICPHCKQTVGINASMAGQTVACPHCSGAIQVPSVPHTTRYTAPAWLLEWSSVVTAAASVIAMIASVISCLLVFSVQRSATKYDQRVEAAEEAVRERVQKQKAANDRKQAALEEFLALDAQRHVLNDTKYREQRDKLYDKYPEIFRK